MPENKKSLMYEIEGKRMPTWNPFVGCQHDCNYCYARDQAKRRKYKCEKCYQFEPHFHPERLNKKFKSGETWFVCSMGDITFASVNEVSQILDVIEKNSQTTFMLQSKDPACFQTFETYPDNLVIGTTIESDFQDQAFIKEDAYSKYSKAPEPIERYHAMLMLSHPRKYVTIEPIMDFFPLILLKWLLDINPEFVYVGYDNHNHKLPEPRLEKTLRLIEELENFTEVRLKTIRKAWNE